MLPIMQYISRSFIDIGDTEYIGSFNIPEVPIRGLKDAAENARGGDAR